MVPAAETPAEAKRLPAKAADITSVVRPNISRPPFGASGSQARPEKLTGWASGGARNLSVKRGRAVSSGERRRDYAGELPRASGSQGPEVNCPARPATRPSGRN